MPEPKIALSLGLLLTCVLFLKFYNRKKQLSYKAKLDLICLANPASYSSLTSYHANTYYFTKS